MHYLIKDTDFKKILNFLVTIKGIHKNDIARLRLFIEAIIIYAEAAVNGAYYLFTTAVGELYTKDLKLGL